MSATDRTRDEIDWPASFDRTDAQDRERTTKFSVTFHDAVSDIETELLDRVGVDDWRLSTAAPHRKGDGLPYANAKPDDPGVVVRWSKDGGQFAVACDRYSNWRDNARAIGLYIKEKRKMSDRPIKTGHDEFATARLPSGDEDEIVGPEPPHEVLGVGPDADYDEVRESFRKLVKRAHGDTPYSSEYTVDELKRAREEMLP